MIRFTKGVWITNGNPELQSHSSFTDRPESLSPESYPNLTRRLSIPMKIRAILGAFVWASLPAMAENMTRRRSRSGRRSGCMNMSTVKECPNEEKAWRPCKLGIGTLSEIEKERRADTQPALSFGSTRSRRLVYATHFVFAPSGIAGGYMNGSITVP